jgi:hypothetical protein
MEETESGIEIEAAQVVDRSVRCDDSIKRVARLHHHDILRVNA